MLSIFNLFNRPFVKFLLLAHAYYLIILVFQAEQSLRAMLLKFPLATSMQLLYSYISLFGLYYLLDTIIPRRWPRVMLTGLFLLSYAFLAAYRFAAWDFLGYDLVRATIAEAFQWGIVEVAGAWLEPEPLVIAVLALGYFGYHEWRSRMLTRYTLPYRRSLGLLLLYGLILGMPYTTLDPITAFIRSGISYYRASESYAIEPDTYPYFQDAFQHQAFDAPHGKTPPVFLLLLESFNTWSVDHQLADGSYLMPVFNRLKHQGLYIEQFYSHTVLSIKGYGVILSGLLPVIRGDLLGSTATLRPLPAILSDHGYDTVVVKEGSGYISPHLHRYGFDKIIQAETLLSPSDTDYASGWGIEDGAMYRHAFRALDALENQPRFTMIITQYNHTSFSVPAEKRQIVPEPASLRDKFSNSIRLSDDGLAVFFEELRNRPEYADAIVIITGDHGYPLGNHGITTTENGIYDESYRVPFLVLWPGHIEPRHIGPYDGVYGHRDIAPTILDLLQLPVQAHHFTGQSVFTKKERPTLLLQPFTGTYLQAVDYPYRYSHHRRTGQEMAFNLETDPDETHNIFPSLSPEKQQYLREAVRPILENNALVQADQIFPKTLSSGL